MLRLTDICKSYENGTEALSNVSFEIKDGEFAFIVGESGSGKSTLLKLMTGEIAPTSGEMIVNGFDINKIKARKMPMLRRTLGVIFQDFRLIADKTVYENVAFAMHVIGAPTKHIKNRVPYVLDLVGLSGKAGMYPTELSGGEQQRVAVARALVNNPRLIIADEPTGNLDPGLSMEIMMLLEKINELGTTVLVVSHEKELVNSLGKRVIALDNGSIISDGMDGYYEYE